MTMIKFFTFTAVLIVFKTTAALSAPFCIESQGVPAECLYYDIRACRQDAQSQGGYCSINYEEISLAEQGAPYCIIDSSMIPVCAHQGPESCYEQASRQDAICFENTASLTQSDPHRFDRAPYRFQ